MPELRFFQLHNGSTAKAWFTRSLTLRWCPAGKVPNASTTACRPIDRKHNNISYCLIPVRDMSENWGRRRVGMHLGRSFRWLHLDRRSRWLHLDRSFVVAPSVLILAVEWSCTPKFSITPRSCYTAIPRTVPVRCNLSTSWLLCCRNDTSIPYCEV